MTGVSRALNAVIAILENRPHLFKELLRDPGSDVKDIVALETRLIQAVNRYAATRLRVGLMRALHVTPPGEPAGETVQTFYAGVRAVEEVFEQLAQDLET